MQAPSVSELPQGDPHLGQAAQEPQLAQFTEGQIDQVQRAGSKSGQTGGRTAESGPSRGLVATGV